MSGAACRSAGRGEVDFPVTLLLPVSALAITAEGSGFVADVPLLVAALDKQGGRAAGWTVAGRRPERWPERWPGGGRRARGPWAGRRYWK